MSTQRFAIRYYAYVLLVKAPASPLIQQPASMHRLSHRRSSSMHALISSFGLSVSQVGAASGTA